GPVILLDEADDLRTWTKNMKTCLNFYFTDSSRTSRKATDLERSRDAFALAFWTIVLWKTDCLMCLCSCRLRGYSKHPDIKFHCMSLFSADVDHHSPCQRGCLPRLRLFVLGITICELI